MDRGRSVLTPWYEFVEAILAVFGRFSAPLDERGNYDGAEALRQTEWTIPARDALVDVVRFLVREDKLTAKMLVGLFERLGHLSLQHERAWNVRAEATAHTRATVIELVLYTVSILILEDRPDLLADTLNATYLLDDGHSQVTPTVFGFLQRSTQWFDEAYPAQGGQRYKNGFAEWMKARASLTALPFSQLVEADVVLSVNAAQAVRSNGPSSLLFPDGWHPVFYGLWEYQPYPLFKRLVSEAMLRQWLPVFRIENVQDLLEGGTDVFKSAYRDAFLGGVNPEYVFGVSQLGRRL